MANEDAKPNGTLYRGQRYGEDVGEWWTTSLSEAEQFAMSRGGNRTYVVLALEEDDQTWLSSFLYAERAGSEKGSWYRIPLADLRARWRGVRVHSGSINIEAEG
jgi:hypothetical protein